MVLNYIWIFFFLIAFVVALVRVIGYFFRHFLLEQWGWVFDKADLTVFSAMVKSTFEMAETSVNIAVYLIGVMTLWLGIMKIGEAGGAVNVLARMVAPLFNRLFPDLPKNHPAYGSMLMNFSANMLGLDNAATPLGLKAMRELQGLNPHKDTATNAQVMFLVLNTSGLTIIPISILALRGAAEAANPSDVFIPILLATFFSTLAGLIAVSFYQRLNLLQPVVLAYLGGATLLIAGIIVYFMQLSPDEVAEVSTFAGNFILFSIIIVFVVLAFRKRIDVYDNFIEGAKEGFTVAVNIIPYLVAMLVAIGVLRASGALDLIMEGLRVAIGLTGVDTRFVDALPTALMKPLSGGASRGLMVETMETFGADSFAGKLASVFQGSTETTFYVIAVYFGSVSIRNTRHAIVCGLIADLTGIIAAIFMAYIFFG
ncbi:nucleoside recognition domain-containing protein [Nafulsella turpanensis]|uniref:nucleoside recognition domain-containing protein n=1 Tax=Nafulsella turpanensis TaxID=1265690 RepID=UPI000345F2DD|nr:spore maturation protein [Nafulsella turpanensis]